MKKSFPYSIMNLKKIVLELPMRKYNLKKRFKRARARSRAMARRRRKHSINYISPMKIGVVCVIAFLVMIFATRATGIFKENVVEINLTAQDAEMYIGEDKPVFVAEVSCEGDTEIILDEDTGFTIQNLIDELNSGTGYTLESDGDGSETGEYEIKAELTSAVSTPLNTDWFDKLKINTKPGTLKVKEIDEEYMASVEAKKNRPMIALTFDDGPGKYTMKLLDALEENHAQATFFMLGQNVEKYEDEVAKMKEIGCELGNHSYDHPKLPKLSVDEMKAEINNTNGAIEAITGEPASVLRPPYGLINEEVKQNVEMPMILWSIDTLDWKTKDTQATIDHVLANVSDGDIVLMHDIYETSVNAAIELIKKLQDQGYYLVTVSELAASRGYELVKGEKYFGFYNE